MTESQPPPTPAECDLRGMPFMPLEVARLLDSDLFALSTGDEFKAAVALWCKSWGQLPAGSLPCDDRILAKLACCSLREWAAVKSMALHKWRLCSDGRLYHPTVAEQVEKAWAHREAQRKRAKRRWGKDDAEGDGDDRTRHSAGSTDCNAGGNAAAYPTAMQGTVEGTVKEDTSVSSAGTPEKRSKRRPEIPLPEGYPDAEAVTEGQRRLRDAGVDLDASMQAERFRNHAAQTDRRCRDWPAAWRNWIIASVERAPKRAFSTAAVQQHASWPGPAELRAAIAQAQGEDFAVNYVDPTGWQDVPEPRIRPRTLYGGQMLCRNVDRILAEFGVTVEGVAA